MTHADLVKAAARWLRNTRKCRIVFSEFSTSAREIPDAIGWRAGWSILVECKTSRNDFWKEQRTKTREVEEWTMGAERFYLTPPGLLKEEDLPQGWGLLELRNGRIFKIFVPERLDTRGPTAFTSEIRMLVSALRRVEVRVGHLDQFVKDRIRSRLRGPKFRRKG